MSGLCNTHRRVASSFRQQALAPRMRACRCDYALRAGDFGRGRHAQRARADRLIRERPTVVGHPHRPIHSVFYDDMGRPDIAPHLIELPMVGHRPVTAQASGRLEAQDAVQLLVCRTGVMQIRSLRRLNGEAPIVDRQIARQELVRRR